MNTSAPTVGVLIRFANSQATLPGVLAALRSQSLQPDRILGVNSHSTDGSQALMQAHGADVIHWAERYDHSRVLNFGLRHLQTDLVLVLSSHTVLEAPDTLEKMVECFIGTNVACVSGKWDGDSYYSDAITWEEMRAKGLRFGSIYSNSMGMIRRCLWEQRPFDETVDGCEDYDWAVAQMSKGWQVRRLDFPFSYQRSGGRRDFEFARIAFGLARRYGLKVAWLGSVASLRRLAGLALQPSQKQERQAVSSRLVARWSRVPRWALTAGPGSRTA